MSLALFLRSVPAIARRHEGIYQMARELEPVLAPYATAVDLMTTLAPESEAPITERRAVVAWLLRRGEQAPDGEDPRRRRRRLLPRTGSGERLSVERMRADLQKLFGPPRPDDAPKKSTCPEK